MGGLEVTSLGKLLFMFGFWNHIVLVMSYVYIYFLLLLFFTNFELFMNSSLRNCERHVFLSAGVKKHVQHPRGSAVPRGCGGSLK